MAMNAFKWVAEEINNLLSWEREREREWDIVSAENWYKVENLGETTYDWAGDSDATFCLFV